ncbi:response regulator transcription factor [Psychrobacillus sp. OK032]|uniref:response regulator transcription factor n=1 Tax=Psychrobacillus sp. OK032 TaxID=1884358 RepID=UPI0008D2A9CA|nr:response regulator transcription factor [Psychrobacillus sp. OK032]SES17509.1 DNA-binding response regulator, OmpR family, contains REC and winged-helix (wHTH) domain [Psychrobacillus sp. OK032]
MNTVKKTILIVEDEESIYDILSYALRKEGFSVYGASTGKKALEYFQGIEIDLVILDLMLPDTTGFELCKEITSNSNLPILMLTARDDIVDKVLGLELGAEDYMTKPFDVREVIARVKVLLRRNSSQTPFHSIKVNESIHIDPRAYAVFQDNEVVVLKPKEYELLLLLAQHKNRVFSREEILDTVWEMDYEGGLRTVDVHVQRIRKKLDSSIIETVFGIGYKMKGN